MAENTMTRALRLSLWLVVLPTLVYTAAFYLLMPAVFPVKVGWQIDPALRTALRAQPLALYLHIVPSGIALGLGLLQFRPGKQRLRRPTHPLVGRLYVGAVGLGGLAGLWLAAFSFAGPVSQLGFGLLAIAWLGTTGLAVRSIRRGEVAPHREWMLRSYALTLAGVTLRLSNLAWFSQGYELSEFHAFNAWFCWVPNLVLAQLWIWGGRRLHAHDARAVGGGR